MFAQLFLLLVFTKSDLPEKEQYPLHIDSYGCTEPPDKDTITIESEFAHYCYCTKRDYEIQFKYPAGTTSFKIPEKFFIYSRISKISVPKECTSIESNAFFGTTIGTFNFETDVRLTIGTGAFASATFTKDFSFPSTLATINKYAFTRASFQGLKLPDDLTTIKERAFQEATFNGDLNLKKGLGSIGLCAFNFSTFAKKVTFENRGDKDMRITIDNYAFLGSKFNGKLKINLTNLT